LVIKGSLGVPFLFYGQGGIVQELVVHGYRTNC